MNVVLVLCGLGIVGLVIATLLSRKDDKKIQELEAKKADDQVQLDKLQKEQAGLHDAAVASQANKTEKEKQEFWDKELNPK